MRVRVVPSPPESCVPCPFDKLVATQRKSSRLSRTRLAEHITRKHTSSNCTANPTRETTTKPDAVVLFRIRVTRSTTFLARCAPSTHPHPS